MLVVKTPDKRLQQKALEQSMNLKTFLKHTQARYAATLQSKEMAKGLEVDQKSEIKHEVKKVETIKQNA